MFILFLLLILLLFFIIYACVRKLIRPKTPTLSSLIGKEVMVLAPIGPTPFDSGKIKVHGDIFPAATEEAIYIPKGSLVYISAIQGIRIIVTTAKK